MLYPLRLPAEHNLCIAPAESQQGRSMDVLESWLQSILYHASGAVAAMTSTTDSLQLKDQAQQRTKQTCILMLIMGVT